MPDEEMPMEPQVPAEEPMPEEAPPEEEPMPEEVPPEEEPMPPEEDIPPEEEQGFADEDEPPPEGEPQPPPQEEQGGIRIVINPSTFKNQKDALCVAMNEAFRIIMELLDFDPLSKPTLRQRRFFSDTAYANDERMLRRTILARIATFDTSVKDPTDEQIEETVEFLDSVLEVGAARNKWEKNAVSRLANVLKSALDAKAAQTRAREAPPPPEEEPMPPEEEQGFTDEEEPTPEEQGFADEEQMPPEEGQMPEEEQGFADEEEPVPEEQAAAGGGDTYEREWLRHDGLLDEDDPDPAAERNIGRRDWNPFVGAGGSTNDVRKVNRWLLGGLVGGA